jgi:hypothetical protein
MCLSSFLIGYCAGELVHLVWTILAYRRDKARIG